MALDGIIGLASTLGQAAGALVGGAIGKGITEFDKLLREGLHGGDDKEDCGLDGLNAACEFGKNGQMPALGAGGGSQVNILVA